MNRYVVVGLLWFVAGNLGAWLCIIDDVAQARSKTFKEAAAKIYIIIGVVAMIVVMVFCFFIGLAVLIES